MAEVVFIPLNQWVIAVCFVTVKNRGVDMTEILLFLAGAFLGFIAGWLVARKWNIAQLGAMAGI